MGPALREVGLALGDQPAASDLVRLARGLHPKANHRLAPSINRKRAYYDLTISPPKSISLAALLNPSHSAALTIMRAHTLAAEATIRLASTMLAGQKRPAPAVEKWLAAVFHHTHTREGDPHLHTHAIFPNIMKNTAGEWRAMQIHIAGANRTRLDLAYGHELARQLRLNGFGASIQMRENGLPELRPLIRLVPRFEKAKKAVLAASAADAADSPNKALKSRWDNEQHSRSGIPIASDRAAMRRRQRLADEIRRPKPADADNPIHLAEQADRWRRILSDQERRDFFRFLDDASPINTFRAHALEELPPVAALVVKRAYARINIDLRITHALLLRASVVESAGRHPFEVINDACEQAHIARRAFLERIRANLRAKHRKARRARLLALTRPATTFGQPYSSPAQTPPQQVTSAVQAPTAPAPVRRSIRRR